MARSRFFLRPVIPTANSSSPNSSYHKLFLQQHPILPSRTVLYCTYYCKHISLFLSTCAVVHDPITLSEQYKVGNKKQIKISLKKIQSHYSGITQTPGALEGIWITELVKKKKGTMWVDKSQQVYIQELTKMEGKGNEEKQNVL